MESLSRIGAKPRGTDAVTIDGHAADVFHYELESAVTSGDAVVDAEYDIDARDGTHISIVLGASTKARNTDDLDAIAASIRIGDLDLGIRSVRADVARDGIVGRLDVPAAGDHHAAVLVLGGSEGGVPGIFGIQLARLGYAALSLAYFEEPGLPNQLATIPLEYFQRALVWLSTRAEVDSARITIWGSSRGGEAALLVASTYPDLIRAVVANVPANVAISAYPIRGPAWTLAGTPLPYATEFPDSTAPTDPAAEIPVERIRGPILLTCGAKDTTWASCPMSHAIIDRLDDASFAYDHDLVEDPDLGHFVNRPPRSVLADPATGGDNAWHRAVDLLASIT